MLIMDYKISPLPAWHYASKPLCYLHLPNANKQQLILTRFCTNNAPFIGSQTAKFYSNLP